MSQVKNIIIMIADGWGFNHVETASYYAAGSADSQVYHGFWSAALSTYMLYDSATPCYDLGYDPELAWRTFDYVKNCATDSAAAATALSTGFKTYQGAIGVGPSGEILTHAIESGRIQG